MNLYVVDLSRVSRSLLVYAHGMGTVMRCPSCDAVVLRVARTRTQLWLDPRGVSLVVMVGGPAPSATWPVAVCPCT